MNLAKALDTAFPGAPLNEKGHHQAKALPSKLDEMRIDAAWVSPLVRTRQTAAPLLEDRGLEASYDERLREIIAGDLEMSTDPDHWAHYMTTVEEWAMGNLDVRMPGGETGNEILARYDSIVADVVDQLSPSATALFVSHGAIIRFWATVRSVNTSGAWAREAYLPNTGVVVLNGDHGGWSVEYWEGSQLPGEASAGM